MNKKEGMCRGDVVLHVGDRVLIGRREFDSSSAAFEQWQWEGLVEGAHAFSPGRPSRIRVRVLRSWRDGQSQGSGGNLHLDPMAMKGGSGTSFQILEPGRGSAVTLPPEDAQHHSVRQGLQSARLKELVRELALACEMAAGLDSHTSVGRLRSSQIQLAQGFLSIGQLDAVTLRGVPTHMARRWVALSSAENPNVRDVARTVKEVQGELAKSEDPIAEAVIRLLDIWREAEDLNATRAKEI